MASIKVFVEIVDAKLFKWIMQAELFCYAVNFKAILENLSKQSSCGFFEIEFESDVISNKELIYF